MEEYYSSSLSLIIMHFRITVNALNFHNSVQFIQHVYTLEINFILLTMQKVLLSFIQLHAIFDGLLYDAS